MTAPSTGGTRASAKALDVSDKSQCRLVADGAVLSAMAMGGEDKSWWWLLFYFIIFVRGEDGLWREGWLGFLKFASNALRFPGLVETYIYLHTYIPYLPTPARRGGAPYHLLLLFLCALVCSSILLPISDHSH